MGNWYIAMPRVPSVANVSVHIIHNEVLLLYGKFGLKVQKSKIRTFLILIVCLLACFLD
ncbi:hypothetical protein BDR22DRAFT_862948 [Usnea florida]